MSLSDLSACVGYIQISQAPDRGEPSSAGEINYDYVLSEIEKLGYTGYIGLEYRPTGENIVLYGHTFFYKVFYLFKDENPQICNARKITHDIGTY